MSEREQCSRGSLLSLILPDEGPYTFAVRRNGALDNRLDALDLAALSAALDGAADVGASFALASFDGGHKRTDVARIRSFVLDADVGDSGYADAKTALLALHGFSERHGLALSLVASGRGVHGYVAVDRELSGVQHHAVGAALLRLAAADGLTLDPHPTPAPEMLMRAPGTLNEKSGVHAKVLRVGRRVELGVLLAAVKPHWETPAPAKPRLVQGDRDALPDDLLAACRQVRSASKNVGPVGRAGRHLLFKSLAWTDGGRTRAHEMCAASRVGYDKDKVDALLDEGEALTGPIKCATWERVVPGGCDGCRHKGRIATPLQVATDLPLGFMRLNGLVHTLGGQDNPPEMVWNEPLRYVQHGVDADGTYRMLLRRWTAHDGVRDVNIPAALLTKRAELLSCLSSQGMVVSGKDEGDRMDRLVRMLFRKGQEDRASEVFSDQFGWRRDGAFVLGDVAYMADGREVRAVLDEGGAGMMARHFKQAGSFEGWMEAVRVLRDGGFVHAQFALLASLSTPLWRFGEFCGTTFCFNHRDTGSGKTVALHLGASVWGDPQPQMLQASTSLLSKMRSLGVLNNLPMFIDEITEGMKPGELNSLVMDVSLGTDKTRMRSTGDFRPTQEWRTVLLTSSNISASVFLQKGRHTSKAQAMRVIDLAVPFKEEIGEVGKAASRAMRLNHGVMGARWVKLLVGMGAERIQDAIERADAEFEAAFPDQLHSTERFWRTSLVLALAAGRLNEGALGFDPLPVVGWGLLQAAKMRVAAKDLEPDAAALVSEYVREHSENTVHMHRKVKDREAPWSPPHDGFRLNRPVYVRLELLYEKDPTDPGAAEDAVSGVLYLSHRSFNLWLVERGRRYEDVRDDLDKRGVLIRKFEPLRGKAARQISLGAGTLTTNTTRERVVALKLESDLMLAGLLSTGRRAHEASDEAAEG